jgi:hypothetical protein
MNCSESLSQKKSSATQRYKGRAWILAQIIMFAFFWGIQWLVCKLLGFNGDADVFFFFSMYVIANMVFVDYVEYE